MYCDPSVIRPGYSRRSRARRARFVAGMRHGATMGAFVAFGIAWALGSDVVGLWTANLTLADGAMLAFVAITKGIDARNLRPVASHCQSN
jgi:hypothetical protein